MTMKSSGGDARRRRWKRVGAGVGVAAVAGFAALNLLACRHAYIMMHYTRGGQRTDKPEKLSRMQRLGVLLWGVNIPRPRSHLTVEALGAGATARVIPGEGGIKLGAWYCSAGSNAPLVILFHGYTSEKSGTLPEAKAFLEMGCSVLLVDFRGSGDSSESYTTIGYDEGDDVAAAVRYARQNLPSAKIILYGQSMGGAAILRAVSDCGVKPDAIVIEAVFDTLLHTVRHRFEAMHTPSFPNAELLVFWGGAEMGFNGFKHNPVAYAAKVTCPALFFHGSADPRAHVEEARSVYEAVAGPKEFKAFANLGHASGVTRFPDEWKKTARDFLRTNGIAVKL